MKFRLSAPLFLILTSSFLLCVGCETTRPTAPPPPRPPIDPPIVVQPTTVATVGADLNTAATKVLETWVKYDKGDKNLLWSAMDMFYAYRDSKPIAADVKSLVSAWTGSKGKALSERLSILFGASSGTPAEKMTALAHAAETAAK